MIAEAAWAQAPPYDQLFACGHVIDPRNGVDEISDVALCGDRIAAEQQDIPRDSARKVIEVSSLYVTPGLVDMHAHFYVHTDGSGTVLECPTR